MSSAEKCRLRFVMSMISRTPRPGVFRSQSLYYIKCPDLCCSSASRVTYPNNVLNQREFEHVVELDLVILQDILK